MCALLMGCYALIACSAQNPRTFDSQGGSSSGSSAVAGSGGTSSGASAGGMSAAGASVAGSAGGPSGGAAGAAVGGMSGSGGSAGAGGASGSGGSSGSSGSSGKAAPEPSAGCSKMNPQTGSAQSPLMVSSHQYYVKLPTNYDATKPYPVMIMFNPTNNPISWAEQSAGFEVTGPKENWIRVYPHPQNSSAGWGAGDVGFFQPFYDQITGNFCMDKARIFAAGESSGGDFSSILGCEHADKIRAIGPCATKPVSQYPLDANSRECTGQVTAVIIHGKNDNVVGPENGPETRDFYTALNHCGTTTMPVDG